MPTRHRERAAYRTQKLLFEVDEPSRRFCRHGPIDLGGSWESRAGDEQEGNRGAMETNPAEEGPRSISESAA